MAVFSDLEHQIPEIISKGLFPILILSSLADEARMKQYYSINPEHRFNDLKLTENQIIVECCSHGTDILTGTEFDVIFPHNGVENFLSVSAILEYVSYNRSYEVDMVPNGYSPLAIINFPQGKPEVLKKLKAGKEKFDFNKHDYFYLTQKKVMEKIVKELDKRKE
ncbi:hypothetical protein [Flavobacterium hungaricum]|uniref:Uncharacterized protein n=1 Tax=Flavobacterium hungaricum TaxID=2082725 RepID=A0ABR9TLP4_9FLAO|nr:hypothetical protein [Flavobacterium hungaricum]MBE8726171.1 hypothetical protein [Flavobacterium hungaricum]